MYRRQIPLLQFLFSKLNQEDLCSATSTAMLSSVMTSDVYLDQQTAAFCKHCKVSSQHSMNGRQLGCFLRVSTGAFTL